MRFTAKIRDFIRYKILIRDSFWYRKLRFHGISIDDLEWVHQTKSPRIRSLGITLVHQDLLFVLSSYSILRNLKGSLSIEVHQKENKITLKHKGLSIPVDSKQEIFIFSEVFHSNIYNINIQSPSIIIDVGFNIGIASLFFALNTNVEKIFAYEPLQPTLEKGMKVMGINKPFSNKVNVHNFGLSREDTVYDVLYSYEKKGNVGITNQKMDRSSSHLEKMTVKDSSPIISDILDSYTDHRIILKIDCEGGEYNIIDRLHETRILERIDFIMIEFHYEGPQRLLNKLSSKYFECLVFGEVEPIGMIYAWRCK
ncbi:MAG: FkbM family methyltransferase [Cyclobacteriaceae bacterium]